MRASGRIGPSTRRERRTPASRDFCSRWGERRIWLWRDGLRDSVEARQVREGFVDGCEFIIVEDRAIEQGAGELEFA